jgi:hypothetical protein
MHIYAYDEKKEDTGELKEKLAKQERHRFVSCAAEPHQKTSTAKASYSGVGDGAFFLNRLYSGPILTLNVR